MATTTTLAALPSTADYAVAQRELSHAHEACDLVLVKLNGLEDDWVDRGDVPNPLPTFSDLGELWDFAEGLRLCAEEFAEMHGRITQQLLGRVNEIRMDAPSYLARKAAA